MNIIRSVFLTICDGLYGLVRWIIFRTLTAQQAHEGALKVAAGLDAFPPALFFLHLIHQLAYKRHHIQAGGATLKHPLMLAAGFVKGHGFGMEAEALNAVQQGKNIIPGWRSVPGSIGLVEFGSFTRWPRMGNPGIVTWRDVPTRSTQNRVGLRNPGVKAAAAFLGQKRKHLPDQFGINIAVSPGVENAEQEQTEVLESIGAFLEQQVYPTWFTLNLSCPNTEDDPGGNQTEDKARTLCAAVVKYIQEEAPHEIPLWVKIGPNLADEQYRVLLRAFEETGVKAVVATNTLPYPAPNDPTVMAGVAGGRLHTRAIEVVGLLMLEKVRQNYTLDVIGCGGVLDSTTYHNFTTWGVPVVQYWSALIYRGPLAAAVIENEK